MNGEIIRENQTVTITELSIYDETNSLKYFVLSGIAFIVITLIIQLWIILTKPSELTLFEKFISEWSAWSDCSPARVFIFISRAHTYRNFLNIF